jgi:tetratricopeptide (TPR) repeat protein
MNDGVRIVRQEAARATLDLPTADLDQEQLKIVTDARGDYQKTLLGRIDFPETHLQIGGLALIRRNLPGARAALQAAVNLDPQLVDAWMTLGRVAFALDGAEATAALMQTAVEGNPDTAILRQSLGNALVELGRFDIAREALETARTLEPRAPSIPLDLARLELSAGRAGAAVAHLERARDTDNVIPESLEMLAVIYAQQGDLAKATTVALELGNRFPLHQPGPEVGALLDLAR